MESPLRGWVRLTPPQLLIAIFILIIAVEIIRLCFGLVMWGQRHNEKKRVSSIAWTAFSICAVLLLVPGRHFAIPIIWTCALVDPLLGELRSAQLNSIWVAVLGILGALIVWFLCAWWFGTPWWLAWLMAPLTVGLEWPDIRWVDDNAMMMLGPLVIVLLLYG